MNETNYNSLSISKSLTYLLIYVRTAIGENSYGGVSNFMLTPEEMELLDGLNVDLKAGKLMRKDGWSEEDNTVGVEWDPTDYVA